MALQPPQYLSPSSINTFQQCPLRFKYSRIDGIREPATEATLLGNFVHDVLEHLYLASPNDRTIGLARGLARQLWESSYAEQVVHLVKADKLNDFRWRAWFCIENLWKIEEPAKASFEGVETEVNSDVNGVTIKGFIDRFERLDNGSIAISDYKTGKVPSKAYEDDKFTQLFIYALLLETMGVGKVDNVELIYLKGPKRLARAVQPKDLQTIQTLITETKEQIDARCNAEYFEPKQSQLCSWCHFKPVCPAWKK